MESRSVAIDLDINLVPGNMPALEAPARAEDLTPLSERDWP
jgi:hypothetical protein